MYLDRLDRQPVQWGVFPRLQVWSMEQISRAVKADHMLNGDFGVVGTLDVAYGENHPRLARDTDGPQEQDEGLCVRMVSKWKNRTPRRMSNRKNLRQYWPRLTGHGTTYADILKSSANDASVVVVELVGFKKEQLRRWMYVAGVFAHKLVSDAVLRFGSKSCWCLAKYPFCLPVFLHSRGGAFYLNERMSPVLELFKAFFRDGCCRLLSYVSHVSFLFRLTETTVRQWMIGCLFLNTVPQAIRPLFCIIWVVEHHQHK